MLGNVYETKMKDAVSALQQAMKSGNEDSVKMAWEQFHESIVEKVKSDFEMYGGDEKALVSRGYRQLTRDEKDFYQKLIKAGKASNPKQELTDLLTLDGGMPETIIQDVYRDLTQQHPLLNRINFQNVKYLTKWLLNDHTVQTAVWGEINSEITKEITTGFKTIDLALVKLSAFAVIPKDMLDLGPTFLDNYVRTFLREALYCALEKAIITGTGKNEPTGLDRDIHKGVSFNSETGYPQKTAVKVTSFSPKEYGALLATLAVSETGRNRSFDQVTMVCNMVDYLTKIMPATTVLNTEGRYVNNLFPFPTEVIRSTEVPTGKAIVFLPEEYFMGIGASKDGTIEYSDDYQFLEDTRVFKIRLHGNGRAYDNTVAILLDISELDVAYITVKQKADATSGGSSTDGGTDDEEST